MVTSIQSIGSFALTRQKVRAEYFFLKAADVMRITSEASTRT